MKHTRKELETSILFFAEKYGQEVNYKAFMASSSALPETVKMIINEMFLQKFNSYHCTDEEYEYNKLLFEYATELQQNGLVVFGQ